MTSRSAIQASAVAIIGMLVASTAVLLSAGSQLTVPIHWGLGFIADAHALGHWGLWLTPLLTLTVAALLLPRRRHLGASGPAFATLIAATSIVLAVVHCVGLAAAVKLALPEPLLIGLAAGGLIAVVGNYCGQIRSNVMFGLRTPWTLASDRVWDRTHRATGKLFVATGLLTTLLCLASLYLAASWLLLLGTLASVLFALAYSYVLWRQEAA